MMCALLVVLFLGLLGLALFTWVAFRVMVLSREFDQVDGFEKRRWSDDGD